MSKNPIEMVKEAIKYHEESQLRLESEIDSLEKRAGVARQNLIDVNNLKQKFEDSLKCLLEAKELEEKEDEKCDEGGD